MFKDSLEKLRLRHENRSVIDTLHHTEQLLRIREHEIFNLKALIASIADVKIQQNRLH